MKSAPSLSFPLWENLALVIKCWGLLIVIRVTLTLKSYLPILHSIQTLKGTNDHYRHPLLFVWAVKKAALFVPKASCLTQALAVKWLMKRADKDGQLCIGVMNNPRFGFKAHAWVVYRDAVIIGGDDSNFGEYSAIIDL